MSHHSPSLTMHPLPLTPSPCTHSPSLPHHAPTLPPSLTMHPLPSLPHHAPTLPPSPFIHPLPPSPFIHPLPPSPFTHPPHSLSIHLPPHSLSIHPPPPPSSPSLLISLINSEYDDSVARTRRLSVARDCLLATKPPPLSTVQRDDVLIYLRWLVSHLHSTKRLSAAVSVRPLCVRV